MSRRWQVGLLAVVLLGAALRFAGLSHDLHEGGIYHPDTPKQMRAIQRFLRGQYYVHTGMSDYDGYPFFNSHLIEYGIRAYRAVAGVAVRFAGIAPEVPEPGIFTLYWTTRVFNALVATLAVAIVFAIGREVFAPGTALLAALFLALSPVDVVSAHYETCDTTAAFFAALASWFALRLHDTGRLRDYALAVVLGTAAFAAKYHGGLVLVSVALAHILRVGSLRALFSRSSLLRIALMAVVFVAAFFVAIPSMFGHPAETLADIVAFFGHVSSSKRIGELATGGGGTAAKIAFSMRRNLPVLVSMLGPVLSAAILFGLVRSWLRDPRLAVLASFPIVYFVLGVSLRPLSHPVYHTVMTPVLFLIGASVLAPAFHGPRAPHRAVAVLAALAAAVGAGDLLRRSLREDFFFYLQDTRRLARAWTAENTPASFPVRTVGYGFQLERGFDPSRGAEGRIVAAGMRRAEVPAGAFALKRFALEDEPLSTFRNPEIVVYLETLLLAPGFRTPILPRLPSASGNRVVLEGGPEFYRSERIVRAAPREPAELTVVSEEPLGETLVFVDNGAAANHVAVSFAGAEREWSLDAQGSTWFAVATPRASFPSGRRSFYRLAARARTGDAWITVATTARDQGVLLFERGEYARALPRLREALAADADPALSALAALAGAIGGERPRDGVELPVDRAALDEAYGGALRYLEALDYVSVQAEDADPYGFRTAADVFASGGQALRSTGHFEGELRSLAIPLPRLDPGPYQVVLRLRLAAPAAKDEPVRMVLRDEIGERQLETEHALDSIEPGDWATVGLPLAIPAAAARSRLSIFFDPRLALAVDRMSLEPDVPARYASLQTLRDFAGGAEVSLERLDPSVYSPLLALGDRLASQGEPDRAAACYLAAAGMRPDQAPPLDALGAIRDRVSPPHAAEIAKIAAAGPSAAKSRQRRVDVRFEGGVRLAGYRLADDRSRPGATIGLNLYWQVLDEGGPLSRTAVWVHFIGPDGKIAFQDDRNLVEDLVLRPAAAERQPFYRTLSVPRDAKPGVYRIRLGLYRPTDQRKLRVRDSDLPLEKRGVVLPDTVTLVE